MEKMEKMAKLLNLYHVPLNFLFFFFFFFFLVVISLHGIASFHYFGSWYAYEVG
jgi:hypothetical protein